MSDEYNGWTNRETWTAALWINNDQGMQEIAIDLAKSDKYGYAIRDMFEDISNDVADGIATRETIMMIVEIGSMWRVNWREIRDSLIEE